MDHNYTTEHKTLTGVAPLEFVRERKASELVECDFLLPQPALTGEDNDRR